MSPVVVQAFAHGRAGAQHFCYLSILTLSPDFPIYISNCPVLYQRWHRLSESLQPFAALLLPSMLL